MLADGLLVHNGSFFISLIHPSFLVYQVWDDVQPFRSSGSRTCLGVGFFTIVYFESANTWWIKMDETRFVSEALVNCCGWQCNVQVLADFPADVGPNDEWFTDNYDAHITNKIHRQWCTHHKQKSFTIFPRIQVNGSNFGDWHSTQFSWAFITWSPVLAVLLPPSWWRSTSSTRGLRRSPGFLGGIQRVVKVCWKSLKTVTVREFGDWKTFFWKAVWWKDIIFFIMSKTVERQLLLCLLLSLRKAQQVLWTQLTAGRWMKHGFHLSGLHVWMPCNEVLYLTHVVAEDKALRFWILGLAWLWMKRFFSDELIGNVVKVEFQNPWVVSPISNHNVWSHYFKFNQNKQLWIRAFSKQ